MMLGVVACACGNGAPSAPEALPPPPAAPYARVANTAASSSLAKEPRPTLVVWVGADGALESGVPDAAWTGELPRTRTRTPGVGALAPASQASDPADPWSTEHSGPPPTRGFERSPAAIGTRERLGPMPLVLAAPSARAASVVEILTKLGGRLGVTQRGGTLAVLNLAFRPATEDFDDRREHWIELHLTGAQIGVLAAPENGRAVVPWTRGTVDLDALGAVYRGFGKDARNLDVFVGADVDHQRLVDVLVALDQLGVPSLGLAKSAGTIDDRIAQIEALRAARTRAESDRAFLFAGRVTSVGELAKHEILAALRSRFTAMLACYEPQLAKQPGLAGEVNMQFFIAPDGTVPSSNAYGLEAVAACVAAQVKLTVFPHPKGGGGVQVNFAVQFRPRRAITSRAGTR